MVPRLGDAHIAIAGLGLMGASMASALRGRCRAVTGVARRPEVVETALARGMIDEGSTSLIDGVRQADIVVLATPVRIIIQQLREIGPHLQEGCLVMDLGSTKAQVVDEMARLPEHAQPLGGHPMCGKEVSGLEVSDPALYQGCTFILSPLPRTSGAALALGTELAEATGAHTLVLEPQRQGFLVGTVSHLPYLLACALVGTADATTSADPAAWKIVAGGFRDTSRVSGSEVSMMVDILLTNQNEVLGAVDAFRSQLGSLARLIETGDEDNLRDALTSIRQTRLEMFP
jgi:prephenate dehydrogenase